MLRSLLAILVAVLATVCLSDFARAAMPADDMADCPARLCDGDLGCGTPVKPQALRPPPTSPAIVVVPSGTLGAPPPAADTIVRPTPDASSSRPLARLAPRAPPGAA